MTLQRISKSGEIYIPRQNRAGEFIVAGPNAGPLRNRVENQIGVATLDEVVKYMRMGFSVRMWRGYGSSVLICPGSIQITED